MEYTKVIEAVQKQIEFDVEKYIKENQEQIEFLLKKRRVIGYNPKKLKEFSLSNEHITKKQYWVYCIVEPDGKEYWYKSYVCYCAECRKKLPYIVQQISKISKPVHLPEGEEISSWERGVSFFLKYFHLYHALNIPVHITGDKYGQEFEEMFEKSQYYSYRDQNRTFQAILFEFQKIFSAKEFYQRGKEYNRLQFDPQLHLPFETSYDFYEEFEFKLDLYSKFGFWNNENTKTLEFQNQTYYYLDNWAVIWKKNDWLYFSEVEKFERDHLSK